MAYDNSYNRNLAQLMRSRDYEYARRNEASPLGPTFSRREGGAHVKFNSASKTDAMDGTYYNMIPNPEVGQGMYGGSGFASGSFRDLGYSNEPVKGADGEGMSGGGASGGKLYEKKFKSAVMPNDMSGGTKLGLPDSLAGGGKLVPVAQMKGQTVSTGGKKPAKGEGMSGGQSRNAVVKAYMAKHGVKMIEASKKVKELGLYKKK